MSAKRRAMYRLTSIEGVRPPSSQRPPAEDLEEVKQKMNAERQAVSADEYTPTTVRKAIIGALAHVNGMGYERAGLLLADHDAQISATAEARGEARGLERGWDECIGEAFTALLSGKTELPANPYRSTTELREEGNTNG